MKEFYTTIQKCTISILVRYITNRIDNDNMIEELQIKHFTELTFPEFLFETEAKVDFLSACI